jgi:hypothetical protein
VDDIGDFVGVRVDCVKQRLNDPCCVGVCHAEKSFGQQLLERVLGFV